MKLDGIRKNIKLGTLQVKKNSPLIFTALGVVGIGATAYLAYKSAKKIEVITDDLEERRTTQQQLDALTEELQDIIKQNKGVRSTMEEEVRDQIDELSRSFRPIKRAEVARDVAGAIAAPVLTAGLSVCAITLSYYIMNKRIAGLAAGLAGMAAKNARFEKKYRKDYGDEAWDKFDSPEEEVESTNDKGKKVKYVKKQERDDIEGRWFDQSSEYLADDHIYNKRFISSIGEKMQDKLFRNGYLVLNDVLDSLGFDRTRAGAIVGWTSADNFDLVTRSITVTDPVTGELKPELYVSWGSCKYIYDSIQYSGRYSE